MQKNPLNFKRIVVFNLMVVQTEAIRKDTVEKLGPCLVFTTYMYYIWVWNLVFAMFLILFWPFSEWNIEFLGQIILLITIRHSVLKRSTTALKGSRRGMIFFSWDSFTSHQMKHKLLDSLHSMTIVWYKSVPVVAKCKEMCGLRENLAP